MKDKEKQIEEMAVICADCNTTCDECFEAFEKIMTLPIADRSEHCQAIKYAKRLFNAGYQKIDKNSVVLTKEEAERFRGQTINIAKVKSQASKETAEKIIDYVYKVTANIVLRDKLAKQFGLEIKE